MKNIGILALIIGLTFLNCNQGYSINEQTDSKQNNEKSKDKEEIQNLIRQVLKWADSEKSIDLLPVIRDSKDSIYIGFDIELHKQNLDKLKETGFFAIEFVENYNQIILTLDRKLRNHEYEYNWLVGDLPPFIFVSWWNGQERFPLQWSTIEMIDLNKTFGEFYFKCGNLEKCIGLENYNMKVKVAKEENKWKILYLEGFDFKESTRTDGVL